MSILSKPLRPPTAPGEAVRRYIAAERRHADPDPLFRRRLRGTVLNRFVLQEGAFAPRVHQTSRMGTLGRACLYASFALAVSVSGAMAASEGAVPGDLLYPLKRNIESLRFDVLPEQYHDELAVEALSARIMELAVLLDSGRLTLAETLSDEVRESYEQLVALSDGTDTPRGLLRAHFAQLEAMVKQLPEAARTAVERAMAGAPAVNAAPGPGPNADRGLPGRGRGEARGGSSNQGDAGPAGGPGPEGQTEPDRTPKPKPTPKPEPTPQVVAPSPEAP